MIDPDIRESMERYARTDDGANPADRMVLRFSNDTRRPAVAAASPIVTLAGLYRQAAGNAYAAGNDVDAAKFRDAAAKLDAVAAELPVLPVSTR